LHARTAQSIAITAGRTIYVRYASQPRSRSVAATATPSCRRRPRPEYSSQKTPRPRQSVTKADEPGKPESQKNAPSDIKVAEGEYGEAGKGRAGHHERRDRRLGDPAKNRGGRFHAGRPGRVGHLKAPAEV